MRSQRVLLRLGWILSLSLAGWFFWGAAAQAGGVSGLIKPAQYEAAPTRGALDLRLRSDEGAPFPPGELLLSDAEARMSGGDAAGNRYQEIPDSATDA